MYQASAGLPHILPPRAYCDPAGFDRECQGVLKSAWHLIGTLDQFVKSGDFITCQTLGHEIQVRNFEGRLKAFSNVCAHRHCLISSKAKGHSSTMRCQYHGWEYGDDGFTRRVPDAKNFAPVDRQRWRLPEYRVETCGQLVFVSLSSESSSLTEFLGPIAELVATRFGRNQRVFYRNTFAYDANWKVAIENSLEAYHVEAIHAKTFRNAPSEEKSRHALNARHTSFTTQLPFDVSTKADDWFYKTEAWLLKRLGIVSTREYQQHHVFPNLLFSFTDAISLIHFVQPLAVDQSQSQLIQFGPIGDTKSEKASVWARSLGRLEAKALDRIMKEDISLYPSIQRGLKCSPHRGQLSRAEERIHRFHQFLVEQQYQTY